MRGVLVSVDKKKTTVISIILSFRNEADVLDELIRRLELVFSKDTCDYELIFVNDDSTDDSRNILEKHHVRNSRVKVINMTRRFGVTECVFAGLEKASGDAVIYMDCDLQDPPELIPSLLSEWRAGADMVYTVRIQRDGEKPFRMYFTKLAYKIIGAFSEVELPVEAGDFRLLDKKIVLEILKLPEMEPYLRGLTSWVGFRKAKVEYVRAPRAGGKTHFPGIFSASAMDQFSRGITSFSFFPLFSLFVVGFLTVSLSIFGLFGALILQFIDIFWSPWLYGGLIILALWGSLVCALGVIGVYLARVYSNVRGRPRFVVLDMLGFSKAKQ